MSFKSTQFLESNFRKKQLKKANSKNKPKYKLLGHRGFLKALSLRFKENSNESGNEEKTDGETESDSFNDALSARTPNKSEVNMVAAVERDKKRLRCISLVDQLAKILFPAVFVTFNLVYFSFYIYQRKIATLKYNR